MNKRSLLNKFYSILMCIVLVLNMGILTYSDELSSEEMIIPDEDIELENVDIPEEEEELDQNIENVTDTLIEETSPLNCIEVVSEKDSDSGKELRALLTTESSFPMGTTGFIEYITGNNNEEYNNLVNLASSIDNLSLKFLFKVGLKDASGNNTFVPSEVKVYLPTEIQEGENYKLYSKENDNWVEVDASFESDMQGDFISFALQNTSTYLVGIEEVNDPAEEETEAIPEETVQDEAVSEETAQSETEIVPDETVQDETVLEETVQSETTPDDAIVSADIIESTSEAMTEAISEGVVSETEITVETEPVVDAETTVKETEAAVTIETEVVIEETETELLIEETETELPEETETELQEEKVLDYNENDVHVTISYNPDALIPENAYLRVSEIPYGSDEYNSYLELTTNKLDVNYTEDEAEQKVRFFDIKIMYQDEEGEKEVQIGSNVKVNIQYDDYHLDDSTVNILHFDDDGNAPNVLDVIPEENKGVSFEAESFSVYAIVEAPEIIDESVWFSLDSFEDIENYNDVGFLIGHLFNCFATGGSEIVKGTRTGITRTPVVDPKDARTNGAVLYHVHATGDKYYIYYVNALKEWRGVIQSADSLSFTDPITILSTDTDAEINNKLSTAGATAFAITKYGGSEGSDVWRINGSDTYCWNRQGNDAGKTIASYKGLTDNNARMRFWSSDSLATETDPYELNGKTYSIGIKNGDVDAYGVTTTPVTVSGKTNFSSNQIHIRPDVIDEEGVYLLSSDVDLTDWLFTNITANNYFLTTTVNGVLKYLSMDSTGVSLKETPDSSCVITVNVNDEKWSFTASGLSLGYLSTNNSFGAYTSSNAVTWLNLLEKNNFLEDDDFVSYSAHLVSISDTVNVTDQKKVVMYVTIWNEETLKYEPYVINYDGTLIKCFDVGNTISWYGSQANSAVWTFTEYHWDDGSPNYYYELQNEYSKQYIAPQISSDQVFSNGTIGVNMNGRRYGEKSTTIIAWDPSRYAYAALDVDEVNKVLKAGPLSQAHEIFFAILDEPVGQLTTVSTIDNNDYGIKMKMVDFNGTVANSRESNQNAVFGDHSNDKPVENSEGIVKSYLVGGYPITDSSVTQVPTASLETLFGSAEDVNHLFIEGIYNEHGYFQFDSTQNFAHLESTYTNGERYFTVYDQLGAMGDSGKTRVHGQFMPYNEIHEGVFTSTTNQTDVFAEPLSDLNPRKGEKLYLVRDPDYYFGMQMEASFVQTESGLDAWGHDIIFEFSGDDDFWLFVDDLLVLDIGGIHSASTGNINFRTGQVELVVKNRDGGVETSRCRNTTLYQLIQESWTEYFTDTNGRAPTSQELADYLDSVFELNDNNQYVFRDYTKHMMKMFYMERGAGASNLKMRFNLSSTKPNTVVLSKDISGTTKTDYQQAEFPYQIYYHSRQDGGTLDHLLTNVDGSGNTTVNYAEKTTPATYLPTYTPAGTQLSYDHVFMLKPTDKVEIHFGEDVLDYWIVECGINTNIYDEVKINETVTAGTATAVVGREDYVTSVETIEDRPRVAYNNHVKGTALRTLTFTKVLYDVDGTTILGESDDSTKFDFRLYLGSENATTLNTAYMQEYYIKNSVGEYCKYDGNTGSFISMGITSIDSSISDEVLDLITFVTSPNGAISGIPVGYTIEVKDLIVGSKFKVEERDNEIPEGYKRLGYECINSSYIIENGNVNEGSVRDNSDPAMLINNKKGWGLTANKVWSDESYASYHDTINLAVYVDGTLLADSVKQLPSGTTSAYWYFDNLESGKTFSDYVVKEVVVNGNTVTPKENGQTITLNYKPVGSDVARSTDYTVTYATGTPVGNTRVDTITNSRNGIKFIKKDMSGNPIQGATFTLQNSLGEDVGAASYTSDSTGLITLAYLDDGTYTLEETQPARGYIGIESPITVVVNNGLVTCRSEEDSSMYSADNTGIMPVVTVRNKEYTLKAVKEDANGTALQGAHFAIYRQITRSNGTVRKDYYPLEGYEDLITDINGLIIDDLQNWDPGYYYLVETEAPTGYNLLAEDVCFRIKPTGGAEVIENGERRVSIVEDNNDISYVIHTIDALMNSNIKFRKVDLYNPTTVFLQNAEFSLYTVEDSVVSQTPLYTGLISDSNGYLTLNNEQTFTLDYGDYVLIEDTPPQGYVQRSVNAAFTVSRSGVSYNEGYLAESVVKHFDIANNVYTLDISNSPEISQLRVSKEVKGLIGYDEKFTFTLTIDEPTLSAGNMACSYKVNGVTTASTIAMSLSEGVLVGTFELGDGEEFIIELPSGTDYTVGEEENSLFWTTVGTSPTHTNIATGTVTNTVSRAGFINHLIVIPPTGVGVESKFGFLLILLSGVGLILILLKKKKLY